MISLFSFGWSAVQVRKISLFNFGWDQLVQLWMITLFSSFNFGWSACSALDDHLVQLWMINFFSLFGSGWSACLALDGHLVQLWMISLFSSRWSARSTLNDQSELVSLGWPYVPSTHVHLFIRKNKLNRRGGWKTCPHEDYQLKSWSLSFDKTIKKLIRDDPEWSATDQLHLADHPHIHTTFILSWSSRMNKPTILLWTGL